MSTERKQRKQKLKLTVTAYAYFELDDVRSMSDWRDEICQYGEIDSERVEVVEG
jgi:hypothetical protein